MLSPNPTPNEYLHPGFLHLQHAIHTYHFLIVDQLLAKYIMPEIINPGHFASYVEIDNDKKK